MTPEQEYIASNSDAVPEAGCWIWSRSLRSNGYGCAYWKHKLFRAHRFSWVAFRGEIPNDLLVLHKCDVRLCVNPSHLFLGTKKDNGEDMARKFRSPSKLTAEQVREIRRLRKAGTLTHKIAKRYGVHGSNVRLIVSRKTWPYA